MRVEQLTANIRFFSGMVLLKKAYPVRNSNTFSFVVSFISCKAQQCALPAGLAEKVPGVGLGVRQPNQLMDTLDLRAGSHTCIPPPVRDLKCHWEKTLVHTFLPNNAYCYCSRSDTIIFLFSSQKVAVKSWVQSVVLFSSLLPFPSSTYRIITAVCICLLSMVEIT